MNVMGCVAYESEQPMSENKPIIEYHPTYFLDEPRKGGRGDYSATLLYDEVQPTKRGARRVPRSVEFIGQTRDDADAKMVEWIDKTGATEKSP